MIVQKSVFKLLVISLLLTVSVVGVSQTRKLNSIDRIDLNTQTVSHDKIIIPKSLYLHHTSTDDDSFTIAEMLFNPDIKLIDPDTFNLKLSVIQPDLELLNRDSTAIIDIHPQDAIQEKVFRIETKDKKSLLVFYGSIRVNGAMDYNGLQSSGTFSTYHIPVGDANSHVKRFFMSASQTRFGVQGTNKTDVGPVNFFIEGDFNGENSSLFRIRHAYVHFINLLAGQTWSVFSDPFSIPWTVDLDGPNSSLTNRSVQIRYSNLINEHFRWTASIESPYVESVSTDSLTTVYQGVPDLAGRMKYMASWGYIQTSIVIRSLGVNTNSALSDESIGYGVLLSGKYDFKPDRTLSFQFVGGEGIARYVTSLGGTQNDLILDPDNNVYVPLPVFGGFVSLGVEWKPTLHSYLTPGFTAVKNKSFQDDDAFSYSAYFSVNTFWDVTQGFRVGAEYSYGSRVNKDNEYGTANRVSFIIYYSF